jgi:hypothetical protein
MLELLYTSTKVLTTPVGYSYPRFMAYIKSWDAMVAYFGSLIYKVFRDGSQAYLGNTDSSWINGNRVLGQQFYFEFTYGTPAWCYGADEITGQVYFDLILNPNAKVLPIIGSYLDDRTGLYLRAGASISVYRLSDGVQVGTISPGFITHNLAYVSQGRVMAFKHDSGDVALIDYLGNQVLWKSKIGPCRWSAYDCIHNLIVTIETDKRVRVYLLTPVPTTLTAPTFTPAAKRFQGCVVKTRLTGASGEVCAGYLVRWEITGVPPKGALWRTATLTDSDGYAENFYFSPREDEPIGSETLKASVVI